MATSYNWSDFIKIKEFFNAKDFEVKIHEKLNLMMFMGWDYYIAERERKRIEGNKIAHLKWPYLDITTTPREGINIFICLLSLFAILFYSWCNLRVCRNFRDNAARTNYYTVDAFYAPSNPSLSTSQIIYIRMHIVISCKQKENLNFVINEK